MERLDGESIFRFELFLAPVDSYLVWVFFKPDLNALAQRLAIFQPILLVLISALLPVLRIPFSPLSSFAFFAIASVAGGRALIGVKFRYGFWDLAFGASF
jgi:hypothetical protein